MSVLPFVVRVSNVRGTPLWFAGCDAVRAALGEQQRPAATALYQRPESSRLESPCVLQAMVVGSATLR
ncbi:MAG: hypothetical protein RL215_1668 [Planctomycetota bacterium]